MNWRGQVIVGMIRGMARQTKSKKKPGAKKLKASGWQVYIVRCVDGSLYTGIARDVVRRMAEHNGDKGGSSGAGASYTRARRPVTLVYCEDADDRSAASKREFAIKQLSRTAKLALIAAGGALE